MTHICVSKLTIIGLDNGLSPGRRQAIIWTNAGILLIGPSGTNFSEFLIEIITFSLKKICLKVSSAKRQPSCLGLNVLRKGSQASVCKQLCHDVCLEKCYMKVSLELVWHNSMVKLTVICVHSWFWSWIYSHHICSDISTVIALVRPNGAVNIIFL